MVEPLGVLEVGGPEYIDAGGNRREAIGVVITDAQYIDADGNLRQAIPAAATTGPTYLDAAGNLRGAVGVFDAGGLTYLDAAGNLRGSTAMTWLAPPTPPEPGPMDFDSNEAGLTEYETDFGVAEPNIAMGMVFAYTGTPTFTVTHEGEPLEVEVQLSSFNGGGVLTAVGRNLTVEDGKLKITATGGTFGPCFGRVNEMGFSPGPVHIRKFDKYTLGEVGSFPVNGKIFLAASNGWSTVYPAVEYPMQMKAFRKTLGGLQTYPTEGLTSAGLGWSYDPDENRWTHSIPNTTQSAPADIDGPTPFTGYPPMGWKAYDVQYDVSSPQLSTYFFDGTTNTSQNVKAYLTGDSDGSWVAYAASTTNVNQNYFRAVGNTSFKDPEVIVNPLFNCGAIASSALLDGNDWNYDNNGYLATAMIVMLVENNTPPAGGWRSFELTAGDTGLVGLGYTAPSSLWGAHGSIDREPNEATTLINLVETTQTRMAFAGDVVALFGDGYTIAIDGVPLTLVTPPYLAGSGANLQTEIVFSDYDFVLGNTYTIERVPAPSPDSNWVLTDGDWNDSGVWADNQDWND